MSWVRASLFEAKAVFSFPTLAIMQLERQQLLGAAAADVGERGGGEKLWKPLLLHAMVWEAQPEKEEKLQVELEDGLSYQAPKDMEHQTPQAT